jgi:hypothetical protein
MNIHTETSNNEPYKTECVWKIELKDNTPYPITMLPEYMLVEVNESRKMCLLHVEQSWKTGYRHRIFYRFSVVEQPADLLKGCEWFDNTNFLYKKEPFLIERKATNQQPQSIYLVRISRLKNYIRSPLLGEIDIFHIHNVLNKENMVMPPEFYKVYKGYDTKKLWHFETGQNYEFFKPVVVVKEVLKEIIQQRIPKHIFEIVVKEAIETKKECPVMMIPFTRENASCGPCGHLVTYEALLRCVQDKKQCPVCRERMDIKDIQK